MLRKILILLFISYSLLSISQTDILRILYSQDFGGNSFNDTVISQLSVPECLYPQNKDNSSFAGSYSVRKVGFFNGDSGKVSQWYRQSDHTYDGDCSRGYFLQVDGGLEHEIFYSFLVKNVPSGETLVFSIWVVNCYTAWQKRIFETEHWPVQDPDIDLLVLTESDTEITRFRIGPVEVDEVLCGATDYECSAEWHNYSFSFTVPDDVRSVRFSLGNRGIGSPGNDFGIDDILVYVVKK